MDSSEDVVSDSTKSSRSPSDSADEDLSIDLRTTSLEGEGGGMDSEISPSPLPSSSPLPQRLSMEELRVRAQELCVPKGRAVTDRCSVDRIAMDIEQNIPVRLEENKKRGEKLMIQVTRFMLDGNPTDAIKFKCVREHILGIRSLPRKPDDDDRKRMNKMPMAMSQLLEVARPGEPNRNYILHENRSAGGYWLTEEGMEFLITHAEIVCDITKLPHAARGISPPPSFMWSHIADNERLWTTGEGADFLTEHSHEICRIMRKFPEGLRGPVIRTGNQDAIRKAWKEHRQPSSRNQTPSLENHGKKHDVQESMADNAMDVSQEPSMSTPTTRKRKLDNDQKIRPRTPRKPREAKIAHEGVVTDESSSCKPKTNAKTKAKSRTKTTKPSTKSKPKPNTKSKHKRSKSSSSENSADAESHQSNENVTGKGNGNVPASEDESTPLHRLQQQFEIERTSNFWETPIKLGE